MTEDNKLNEKLIGEVIGAIEVYEKELEVFREYKEKLLATKKEARNLLANLTDEEYEIVRQKKSSTLLIKIVNFDYDSH